MASTSFAIALFENEAESDDELTFAKNDFLEVLKFDYQEVKGWWLCKLIRTNEIGLAAGNRLKIIKATEQKLLNHVNRLLNKLQNASTLSSSTSSSVSSMLFSSTASLLSSYSSKSTSMTDSSSLSSSSTRDSSNSASSDTPNATGVDVVKNESDTSTLTKASVQRKPKIALPPKKKLADDLEKMKVQNIGSKYTAISANDNDTKQLRNESDDYYDYDIPENNMSIFVAKAISDQTHSEEEESGDDDKLRKSSSPTIDSGIRENSFISINSELANSNSSSGFSASICSDDSLSLRDNLSKSYLSNSPGSRANSMSKELTNPANSGEETTQTTTITIKTTNNDNNMGFNEDSKKPNQFYDTLNRLANYCNELIKQTSIEFDDDDEDEVNYAARVHEADCKLARNNLNNLKILLGNFIENQLDYIKENHAAFHPNLEVFNKYKYLRSQLREFHALMETTLNTRSSLNNDERSTKTTTTTTTTMMNELHELLARLVYLNTYLDSMRKLIEEENVFDYQSAPLIEFRVKPGVEASNDSKAGEVGDDDDDYCEIDDAESADEKTIHSEKSMSMPLVDASSYNMTLRIKEQKIKREISLATTNMAPSDIKLAVCDKMLLKFYLKHIDGYMKDILAIYQLLNTDLKCLLDAHTQMRPPCDELIGNMETLANKFALNGHKLVFICDTLNKNLSNQTVKGVLKEASNSLCDALKIYMIRIKSNLNPNGSTLPRKPTQSGNKLQNSVFSSQKLNRNQFNSIVESLNSVLSSSNNFKTLISNMNV